MADFLLNGRVNTGQITSDIVNAVSVASASLKSRPLQLTVSKIKVTPSALTDVKKALSSTIEITGAKIIGKAAGVTKNLTATISKDASAQKESVGAFKGVVGAIKSLTSKLTNVASGITSSKKFATGGTVPGSGNSDTVPAMLTPGEFVINKKAASAIGSARLHRLNRSRFNSGGKVKGGVQYFADGGVVVGNVNKGQTVGVLSNNRTGVFSGASHLINAVDASASIKKALGKIKNKRIAGSENYLKNALIAAPFPVFTLPENVGNVKIKKQVNTIHQEVVKRILDGTSAIKEALPKNMQKAFSAKVSKGEIEKHLSFNQVGGRIFEAFTRSVIGSVDTNTSSRIDFENSDLGKLKKLIPGLAKGRGAKIKHLDAKFGFPIGRGLQKVVGSQSSVVSMMNKSFATLKKSGAALFPKGKNAPSLIKKLKIFGEKTQRDSDNAEITKTVTAKTVLGMTKNNTVPLSSFQGLSKKIIAKMFNSNIILSVGEKGHTNAELTELLRSKSIGEIVKTIQGQSTRVKAGEPYGNFFKGVPLKRATGGTIPGSGDSDTVPAMLTPGEFVINKKAANIIGESRLQQLNRSHVSGTPNFIGKHFGGSINPQKFAYGGTVRPQKFAGGGSVLKLSNGGGIGGDNPLIKIGAGAKALQQDLTGINRLFGLLGDSIAKATLRMAAFNAASRLVFAVQDSLRQAAASVIELNQALTNVNKIFKLSSGGIKQFKGELISLAEVSGQNISDVVEATQIFVQQGLSQSDVLDAVKASTLAANAANLTLQQSTELITSTVNGFNLSFSEASDVIDVMTTIADKSASTVQDLTVVFQKAASTAQEFGLKYGELAAVAAVVRQSTRLSAETVGSGLKTIFVSLVKNEGKLNDFGIATRDANGELLSSLDILRNMSSGLEKVSDSQKKQLLITIAGKRRITELTAALKNMGEINDLVNGSMNSQGNAASKQAKQLETLTSKINKIKTSAIALIDSFASGGLAQAFSVILTVVNVAVRTISNFAGALSNIPFAVPIAGMALLGNVVKRGFKFIAAGAAEAIGSIVGFGGAGVEGMANVEKASLSVEKTIKKMSTTFTESFGFLTKGTSVATEEFATLKMAIDNVIASQTNLGTSAMKDIVSSGVQDVSVANVGARTSGLGKQISSAGSEKQISAVEMDRLRIIRDISTAKRVEIGVNKEIRKQLAAQFRNLERIQSFNRTLAMDDKTRLKTLSNIKEIQAKLTISEGNLLSLANDEVVAKQAGLAIEQAKLDLETARIKNAITIEQANIGELTAELGTVTTAKEYLDIEKKIEKAKRRILTLQKKLKTEEAAPVAPGTGLSRLEKVKLFAIRGAKSISVGISKAFDTLKTNGAIALSTLAVGLSALEPSVNDFVDSLNKGLSTTDNLRTGFKSLTQGISLASTAMLLGLGPIEAAVVGITTAVIAFISSLKTSNELIEEQKTKMTELNRTNQSLLDLKDKQNESIRNSIASNDLKEQIKLAAKLAETAQKRFKKAKEGGLDIKVPDFNDLQQQALKAIKDGIDVDLTFKLRFKNFQKQISGARKIIKEKINSELKDKVPFIVGENVDIEAIRRKIAKKVITKDINQEFRIRLNFSIQEGADPKLAVESAKKQVLSRLKGISDSTGLIFSDSEIKAISNNLSEVGKNVKELGTNFFFVAANIAKSFKLINKASEEFVSANSAETFAKQYKEAFANASEDISRLTNAQKESLTVQRELFDATKNYTVALNDFSDTNEKVSSKTAKITETVVELRKQVGKIKNVDAAQSAKNLVNSLDGLKKIDLANPAKSIKILNDKIKEIDYQLKNVGGNDALKKSLEAAKTALLDIRGDSIKVLVASIKLAAAEMALLEKKATQTALRIKNIFPSQDFKIQRIFDIRNLNLAREKLDNVESRIKSIENHTFDVKGFSSVELGNQLTIEEYTLRKIKAVLDDIGKNAPGQVNNVNAALGDQVAPLKKSLKAFKDLGSTISEFDGSREKLVGLQDSITELSSQLNAVDVKNLNEAQKQAFEGLKKQFKSAKAYLDQRKVKVNAEFNFNLDQINNNIEDLKRAFAQEKFQIEITGKLKQNEIDNQISQFKGIQSFSEKAARSTASTSKTPNTIDGIREAANILKEAGIRQIKNTAFNASLQKSKILENFKTQSQLIRKEAVVKAAELKSKGDQSGAKEVLVNAARKVAALQANSANKSAKIGVKTALQTANIQLDTAVKVRDKIAEALQAANAKVSEIQGNIDSKTQEIADAGKAIDDARASLADAQKALAEAIRDYRAGIFDAAIATSAATTALIDFTSGLSFTEKIAAVKSALNENFSLIAGNEKKILEARKQASEQVVEIVKSELDRLRGLGTSLFSSNAEDLAKQARATNIAKAIGSGQIDAKAFSGLAVGKELSSAVVDAANKLASAGDKSALNAISQAGLDIGGVNGSVEDLTKQLLDEQKKATEATLALAQASNEGVISAQQQVAEAAAALREAIQRKQLLQSQLKTLQEQLAKAEEIRDKIADALNQANKDVKDKALTAEELKSTLDTAFQDGLSEFNTKATDVTGKMLEFSSAVKDEFVSLGVNIDDLTTTFSNSLKDQNAVILAAKDAALEAARAAKAAANAAAEAAAQAVGVSSGGAAFGFNVPNFASGSLTQQEKAGLIAAAIREKANKPSGSQLMVANTSETVLTKRQAEQLFGAGFQTNQSIGSAADGSFSITRVDTRSGKTDRFEKTMLKLVAEVAKLNGEMKKSSDASNGLTEANAEARKAMLLLAENSFDKKTFSQSPSSTVTVDLSINSQRNISLSGVSGVADGVVNAVSEQLGNVATKDEVNAVSDVVNNVILEQLQQRGLIRSKDRFNF